MSENSVPQPEWTMSQERAFMEDLVSKRFHFFIVIFTAIVAGCVAANRQSELIAILVIGAIVCSAFSLTIYRAHVKLDQILKRLHAVDGHPVKVIGQAVGALGVKGLFSVAWIVGVLPLILSVGLMIAALLACVGCVTAG